jgi:hypothetical protein
VEDGEIKEELQGFLMQAEAFVNKSLPQNCFLLSFHLAMAPKRCFMLMAFAAVQPKAEEYYGNLRIDIWECMGHNAMMWLACTEGGTGFSLPGLRKNKREVHSFKTLHSFKVVEASDLISWSDFLKTAARSCYLSLSKSQHLSFLPAFVASLANCSFQC